jgi:prepilin-type N-terminal cleavage/methylation domain-containing protein
MRLFTTRFKQKGIGLLELMLALAIIAILIVMVTRYFGKASQSQKLTVTASQIAELYQALHHWKTSGVTSVPPTLATLAEKGLITKQLAEGSTPLGKLTLTGSTTAKIETGDLAVCTAMEEKVPEGVDKTCGTDGSLELTFK